MAGSPTISVVIQSFNNGKFIEAALSSILRQTFTDFEVILIDDGSTDGTLRVMQEVTAQDPRCRIITRENRGIVASLNEGIASARGAYLFKMDGDDIARPQRFEKQLNYLNAHPEHVAVGTKAQLIDPEGLPLMEYVMALDHDAIDALHMKGTTSIVHPSVAIRREAVVSVGGYRKQCEWAEDLDLFLRLGETGRLANLPEVLLDYRQHGNSVGYAKRVQQVEAANTAVRDARARRGLPEAPKMPVELAEADASSIHRKWAWWALKGRNVRSARKHALRAFQLNPVSVANAKVLACAVRGY